VLCVLCLCLRTPAAAGGNTVIPDHTLQKAAIEQFLSGGLTLEAITYQVRLWVVTGC
jgi:hypothetical protein